MKKKYIFVHGLSGWGTYDKAYKRMPYWGMRGGDLVGYFILDNVSICRMANAYVILYTVAVK